MKLLSYEVTNWGPHQSQKLIFPKEAKTIAICGENDQGKSWILRGIAFTLSIGRNEYGDQSSIHIGEKEAYHKLTIEHNNTEYTIEKVVKGKTSEEEGTSTWLNGEKKDRAGLEEFYHSTLGLPPPNVWIPICISMQNQTDFHLRGKKRDREEALRQACQLTKIDAWKDSLGALVREEEKSLTESTATIKAKIEMVGAQIKDITEAERKYKEGIKSVELREKTPKEKDLTQETHLTPEEREEFWHEVQNNSKLVREWIKDCNRKELEQTNLLKETDLLTNICTRTEKELSIAFPNQANEENLRLRLQFLERTHQALKLDEASSKSLKCVASLNEIDQKIKDHEAEISKKNIGNSQELLTKKYRTLSEIEGLTGKIDQLNKAHNLNLPTIKNKTVYAYQKTADKFRRLLESGLEEDIEVFQNALEGLAKIASDSTGINLDQEISPIDYYKWRLKTITGVPENELLECSLCQTTIAYNSMENQRPQGYNRGVINDLAKSLEEEIHIKIGKNSASDSTAYNSSDYENAIKLREETKKSLATFQNLNQLLVDLSHIIKDAKEGINDHHEPHNPPSYEELTVEEIEKLVKESIEEIQFIIKTKESLEWTKKEKELVTKEKLQIDKNIEDLKQEGKFLGSQQSLETSEFKEAQEKYSLEGITSEIANARSKVREIEGLKEKNIKKSKELDHSKTRLGLLKTSLMECDKEILSIKERLEHFVDLPMPLPIPSELLELDDPDKPKWEDLVNIKRKWQILATCWEERINKYQKLKVLSEELPQKKKNLKNQQLCLLESLEKEENKSHKILRAKQLMDFLDYKKAPRILLEQIVDQLFYVTNKLAEALSIDTSLIRGKNLEFLTRQPRHSKILEQKTERLGFGKGAMLGICFRLACQKLLLPETGFLLLDEPTANVDNKRKSALKTFIQGLSETSESKTNQIILIEHDQDVVELCQSKIEISNTSRVET